MKIKDLRLAAGLTQAQLVELSGISRGQVQKLERGEIQLGNITLTTAAKLAEALGVGLEELAAEINKQR